MNNVAIMHILQSEQQMFRDALDQEERHGSGQAAIDVKSSVLKVGATLGDTNADTEQWRWHIATIIYKTDL
jgi:hypothetical protein